MAKNNITVKITGDTKGLKGALDDSEGMIGKFAGGVGKVAGIAAIGMAAIGGAAIAMAPQILAGGVALESLGVKSATVFEGSLGDVQTWASGVAKSMGLTERQAVGMAAGFADLLKPMGFSAEQAAQMSTDVLDLSGALSAWSGGQLDAAQVSDVLAKAMLGERDGLKALGISISEADVQARLAANGTDQLTGAALEQAKAVATQQLIMAKSTDAQKAWADGSMSAAQQQNTLTATIATLKESLIAGLYPVIQAILPAVTALAEWMGQNLPAAFEAVRLWVETNWPTIRDTVLTVVEAIRAGIAGFITFVSDAWKQWGDEILAVVNAVWPVVQQLIAAAVEIIRGVIKTVTSLITGDWSAVWDGVTQIVSGAWEAIKGIVSAAIVAVQLALSAGWAVVKSGATAAFEGIKSTITGIIGGIGGAISGIWTGLVSGAKGAMNSVIGVINAAINQINKMQIHMHVDVPIGPDIDFDWNGLQIPNLPQFANGGIVDRPTLAWIGEAGREAVIPLDRPQRARAVMNQAGLSGASGGPLVGTLVVNDGRSVWDELKRVQAMYGRGA